MSDDDERSSIPTLAKRAAGFLAVVAATAIAWWATPTGDLTLPTKVLAPAATAFLGVLGAWASWTYLLWKRDSKRERIKDAISKSRMICHCSESGEIMTQHHAIAHNIDVYACPTCSHIEIVHPKGLVLIADDTEFRPPMPATARQRWLQRSRAQR